MYIKEVDDLPKEVKLARALGAIGEDNVVSLTADDYLRTSSSKTALKDIPGIKDLITRYVEFASKIEELVSTRQAGKGQPQHIHFSSERDRKRVFEFVEKFYDGDPNGTFQRALRHYYKERFASETDRKKVEELIKLVETDLSALPSKRKGLDPEVAKAAGVTGAVSPAAVQKIMGKNFLGPEQWKAGFKVDVGAVPPLPKSITTKLLESECPLHPGEKIKDTHIVMLVPKEVNGEPYSAVKLGELCSSRKGSGDKLIYDGADWANAWKAESWAKESPVASEWVLIPKSDPDPKKMREKYPADGDERHFRSKRISRPKDERDPDCKKYQSDVHAEHYPEYREAKAIEVMTAALLNDVVNGEPRMLAHIGSNLNYLRCVEPSASGGRVLVGCFDANGLKVTVGSDDDALANIGRSLAWELDLDR